MSMAKIISCDMFSMDPLWTDIMISFRITQDKLYLK